MELVEYAGARAERTDVHQHLWVPELARRPRARDRSPYVVGSTLRLDGEPDFEITAAAQDAAARAALDPDLGRIVLSMSSPLGMESLPPEQARPLLDAWHAGVLALPEPFTAWASVSLLEPDLDELDVLLDKGLVGLQLPANVLTTPAGIEAHGALLRHCELAGKPVFVHPGPVGLSRRAAGVGRAPPCPPWWPAVVDYAAAAAFGLVGLARRRPGDVSPASYLLRRRWWSRGCPPRTLPRSRRADGPTRSRHLRRHLVLRSRAGSMP